MGILFVVYIVCSIGGIQGICEEMRKGGEYERRRGREGGRRR
jgi:hypothetical protein